MSIRFLFILFFNLFFLSAFSQNALIKGKVKDENGSPLFQAGISIQNTNKGTYTKEDGSFELSIPSNTEITIIVSYFGQITKIFSLNLKPGETRAIDVNLEPDVKISDTLNIKFKKQDIRQRVEVSSFKIDPKIPKYLPSAFGDFNKILVTLPGVVSNSELTSQYSVRGGNFDENLVYVNDIEIYRPFLVRAGQQEGLSFVNPDLVSDIEFSSGGWQPRFGDKLSSVLSVKYKVPRRFRSSASLSLLGGTFHLENRTKNQRISYVIGSRYKSAQYLLNTLQTKGEYKPRFFDIQSYLNFDLTKRMDSNDFEKRTTLGLITSYGRNKYFVIPTTRETSFGTFDQVIKLSVAFEGQELLEYETWQAGLKFSHKFNERLKTDFILSGMNTGEREYGDVEGAYKLCDIDTDPNSSQFNQCIFTRGVGTLFDHSRNKLTASIFNFSHKGYYNDNEKNEFQWGISQGYEEITDNLSEYSFIDSVGYVTIKKYLNTHIDLNSFRTQGYAQHSFFKDTSRFLTYGFRLNYWSVNNQLLFSPRLQYSWKPKGKKDIVYKTAIGFYQQPPFYRELRDFQGVLNKNVKAQTSIHAIFGRDLNFKAWGRNFKFTAEAYGKYLYNVIPYDVDNVRIRYYALNNAKAYVAGADFRVNGEFIRDAESWFSLGILTAREDVEGDNRGYIRRPTDQRVTAAIFFQDYIPNNPTIKAYVNLVFGSGLPFGPPNSVHNRSVFSSPPYRRLDLGFSKLLVLNDKELFRSSFFETLSITAEILNVLGVNNTISYLWITDVSNNQFAVPNTLSQRFINFKIIGSY